MKCKMKDRFQHGPEDYSTVDLFVADYFLITLYVQYAILAQASVYDSLCVFFPCHTLLSLHFPLSPRSLLALHMSLPLNRSPSLSTLLLFLHNPALSSLPLTGQYAFHAPSVRIVETLHRASGG